MLIEEVQIVLDALLVEGLDDHVAGAVGGVTGAPHRPLSEVAGVPTEPALVDPAVRRSVEREPHMLELEHCVDRFAGEDFRGILIDEVITALDGVEHVPFPPVRFGVAEGGGNPALRRAGVRTGWIELANDGGIGFSGQLDGSHEPGASGADYDRIEAMIRHVEYLRWPHQTIEIIAARAPSLDFSCPATGANLALAMRGVKFQSTPPWALPFQLVCGRGGRRFRPRPAL